MNFIVLLPSFCCLFLFSKCTSREPNTISAFSTKHGFVGPTADFSPENYEDIWQTLFTKFGDIRPAPIQIVKHAFENGSSLFRTNTNPVSVMIHPNTYHHEGVALNAVSHETTHKPEAASFTFSIPSLRLPG